MGLRTVAGGLGAISVFAVVVAAVSATGGIGLGCSSGQGAPASPTGTDGGAPGEDAGGDTGTGVVPDTATGCIRADAGVLPLTSDGKPISFVVATADVATGDWQGEGGYVAQVFF